jgi:hypothetical protein
MYNFEPLLKTSRLLLLFSSLHKSQEGALKVFFKQSKFFFQKMNLMENFWGKSHLGFYGIKIQFQVLMDQQQPLQNSDNF